MFLTASIKSSRILTEIFAFVTFSRSVFRSINSSTSGWEQSMEIISAPLRPFCPMSAVTREYSSIKETEPLVSFAALLIFAPRGLSFEISTPHPPP